MNGFTNSLENDGHFLKDLTEPFSPKDIFMTAEEFKNWVGEIPYSL